VTLRSFTTLLLVFLACVGVAFVISVVVLRRYQRAVVRSMAERISSPGPAAPPRTAINPPARPLGFVTTRAETAAAAKRGRRFTLDEPRKTALVYLVSGVCFALAMFLITFRTYEAAYVGRAAMLVWSLSWPAMMVWKPVSGVGWRGWWAGVAVYFAIGVTIVAAHSALFPADRFVSSRLGMAGSLWAAFNWGMTAAVPFLMARRVRAVGVLVLAAAVLASLGALAAVKSQQAANLVVVAAVAAGALGWPALAGISRLYNRRLISDESLYVDAIWLLYGAMTAMFRWDQGLSVVLPAAIVPFAVFKLVSHAGFAWLGRGSAPPRKLLLLRVFALGDRSRQLFRALAVPWRYDGPIRLITGPDLATETVEPNEFLDFIGRRLTKHFIDSDATLDQRVRALESRPDFDGRYRVEELFCHDDTWTAALGALIRGDHLVLMDLRSFSPLNRGCIYEVEELLNLVPLPRMMFVVDGTTDEMFLKATLTDAWARLDADSPNRDALEPRVRLFRLDRINSRTIRRLASDLLQPASRF